MYGFTMSTPHDKCYRFATDLELFARDEGAAVWVFRAGRAPAFVGSVIRGVLVKA
jgi:hypothetical protein